MNISSYGHSVIQLVPECKKGGGDTPPSPLYDTLSKNNSFPPTHLCVILQLIADETVFCVQELCGVGINSWLLGEAIDLREDRSIKRVHIKIYNYCMCNLQYLLTSRMIMRYCSYGLQM